MVKTITTLDQSDKRKQMRILTMIENDEALINID